MSWMIQQFDVVLNPIRAVRVERPYLISIQHKFLDAAESRLLAPLAIEGAFAHWPRLNPDVEVHGRRLYFVPTDLIALPLKMLGKAVANLEADRHRIVPALNLVFTGI